MNELHLFAGAGGGILGGMLCGHTTVCAVEIEPYCRKVLLQRQRDGILPKFPIWDDVCTFDGTPWRGKVDVVCGGFPCQDISCAGKGAGIKGERSSMWKHMARIIGEVRPKYAFVENSPMLVGRGLTRVLSDLANLGYDARWGVVGAHHVAAPHKRDRIWVLGWDSNSINEYTLREFCKRETADTCGIRSEFARDGARTEEEGDVSYPMHQRDQRWEQQQESGKETRNVAYPSSQRGCSRDSKWQDAEDARELTTNSGDNARRVGWWDSEPNVGRVAHGVASRVDRLKAIGNGQVPAVAAMAWKILSK